MKNNDNMDYDELDNMERKITESVISTNMLTEKNHHFDAADNKNMDRLFDMLINHAADTIRTQFEHNPSDFDGKSLVILNPVRRSAMSNKSMNCFSRYLYLLCKKSKLDKSILGKINTHDPFVHIDDSEFSRVMRAEKFMLGSFPDITLVVPVRSSRDMSDRDVMYVAGLAKMFTNTSIAQGAGAVSQSSFNLTNDAGVQQRLTLFLSDWCFDLESKSLERLICPDIPMNTSKQTLMHELMHVYDNQLANTAAVRIKNGLSADTGPVSQLDSMYCMIDTNQHFDLHKRTLCQRSFTDFVYMTNVTEVKAFLNGLYGHVYDSLDLIYGKERLNANINHHIIYRIMKDKRKMIAETLNHYRPFMIWMKFPRKYKLDDLSRLLNTGDAGWIGNSRITYEYKNAVYVTDPSNPNGEKKLRAGSSVPIDYIFAAGGFRTDNDFARNFKKSLKRRYVLAVNAAKKAAAIASEAYDDFMNEIFYDEIKKDKSTPPKTRDQKNRTDENYGYPSVMDTGNGSLGTLNMMGYQYELLPVTDDLQQKKNDPSNFSYIHVGTKVRAAGLNDPDIKYDGVVTKIVKDTDGAVTAVYILDSKTAKTKKVSPDRIKPVTCKQEYRIGDEKELIKD